MNTFKKLQGEKGVTEMVVLWYHEHNSVNVLPNIAELASSLYWYVV